MRRLFAFITLALSLIVATIVGIPAIKENTNKGTEFSDGYSIVYHLTDKVGDEYSNESQLNNSMDKALENISNRLDLFGISNPDISIEGDDYIRVTIPKVSSAKLDSIRFLLQNNAKVTVTDENDNILISDAKEVFSDISLIESNGTIYCQYKIEDVERMTNLSRSLAASYTGTTDSPYANFIVWLGYEENYSDEKAEYVGFTKDSFSEVTLNPYAASKLLSTISVDSTIDEDFTVQAITTSENVNVVNELINSQYNNYTLNEVSYNKVGSYLDETIPVKAIFATLIAVLVIAVLMIVLYRVAGIVTALSTIVYTVAVFVVYNLFGGLFGIETIIAILIGLTIAIDTNVVFLERIKDEIRKGKTISRSYEEGSKKSVSSVLDCNILILIAGFALYLFGNQIVKSFASIIIISQVINLVLVVLLSRLMLKLLCNSSKLEDKPEAFGVKKSEVSDVNNLETYTSKNKFNKVNFVGKEKLKGIISSGIVAAGLVFALIFGLTTNHAFNGITNVDGGTRISLRTANSNFATEEGINNFLSDEEYAGRDATKIIITSEKVSLSENQLDLVRGNDFAEYNVTLDGSNMTVYDITVYYSKALDATKVEALDTYFNAEADKFYNEDNDVEILKTNYSCKEFKSNVVLNALRNGLWALLALVAFSFVYLIIRFSISYAVAGIVTILHNELIFTALLAIFRLPLGAESIALGLGVALITLLYLVVTFDKLRENISEASNVAWDNNLRKEFVNVALQETAFGNLLTVISVMFAALLVGVLCGLEITPLTIAFIFGIVASYYGLVAVMPYIFTKVEEKHFANKEKRKARRAKKAKENPIDQGQPQEYVFFGVND